MGRRDNDIKAPDGYVLGGLRLVRADRSILFSRGFWGPTPESWIGYSVWVHEHWICGHADAQYRPEHLVLEAAAPGMHIYEARTMQPPHTVMLERTERPDAKPCFRRAERKEWAQPR